jgi:hypothetical protein
MRGQIAPLWFILAYLSGQKRLDWSFIMSDDAVEKSDFLLDTIKSLFVETPRGCIEDPKGDNGASEAVRHAICKGCEADTLGFKVKPINGAKDGTSGGCPRFFWCMRAYNIGAGIVNNDAEDAVVENRPWFVLGVSRWFNPLQLPVGVEADVWARTISDIFCEEHGIEGSTKAYFHKALTLWYDATDSSRVYSPSFSLLQFVFAQCAKIDVEYAADAAYLAEVLSAFGTFYTADDSLFGSSLGTNLDNLTVADIQGLILAAGAGCRPPFARFIARIVSIRLLELHSSSV